MTSGGFQATSRWLIFVLPYFTGAIKYVLRVALKHADDFAFFPISLVACGISLNVASTALSQHSMLHPRGRKTWFALDGRDLSQIWDFSPRFSGWSCGYFAGCFV